MAVVLLIVQIVLSVLIITTVLLQKSGGVGLGSYSGSNDSIFGAKGPSGFLAKLTVLLGIIFILNTVGLGYLYNKASNRSVIDNISAGEVIPDMPLPKELFKQDSEVKSFLDK